MVRTEAFGMKICIAYVTHRENKNVEKRSINFHERQVFEIRRSLKNTKIQTKLLHKGMRCFVNMLYVYHL